MKKLLIIIPSLEPGGAEYQAINQLNYLAEQGYENIRLLILSNQHTLTSNLTLNKKYIHTIEGNSFITVKKGIIKRLPFLAGKTLHIIKTEKITDVIAILPLAHIVSRIAKTRNFFQWRKPFNLNTYYRDVYYQASPLNTFYKKAFNKLNSFFACLFDNRSLFISQAVYKDIKANLFVRNPLILPNSLPVRNISGKAGKEYLEKNKIAEDNQYLILIPGRLHSKKGHSLFIGAFSDFIKQKNLMPNDIKVFLAGEGPARTEITNKIAELQLEEYFHINGFTENTLLLSLYKCADLVVIPSIHEGFGNVAIEALMQQSLILASDTGGLGEIITDGVNGYLFEKGNADMLFNKLIYLYENRDKNLINKLSLYADFINKYTVEKQVKKLMDFCKIPYEENSHMVSESFKL